MTDESNVIDDPDEELVDGADAAEAADAEDGDAESSDPDSEDEAGRQKRENVRVDIQLPLIVRMHGKELPARTRDVSATGIGFSTRLPVELEQHAEIEVHFGDWTFVKEVVIRFVRPILAGCMVGAQFDSLSEDERERLVKQVFDVQREQLRAGRRAVPGS